MLWLSGFIFLGLLVWWVYLSSFPRPSDSLRFCSAVAVLASALVFSFMIGFSVR